MVAEEGLSSKNCLYTLLIFLLFARNLLGRGCLQTVLGGLCLLLARQVLASLVNPDTRGSGCILAVGQVWSLPGTWFWLF